METTQALMLFYIGEGLARARKNLEVQLGTNKFPANREDLSRD
jgi:hypothetical protein